MCSPAVCVYLSHTEHEKPSGGITRRLMLLRPFACGASPLQPEDPADKANRHVRSASSCSRWFNTPPSFFFFPPQHPFPIVFPPQPTYHLLLLPDPSPPSCISPLHFGAQQHPSSVVIETVEQQQVGRCCGLRAWHPSHPLLLNTPPPLSERPLLLNPWIRTELWSVMHCLQLNNNRPERRELLLWPAAARCTTATRACTRARWCSRSTSFRFFEICTGVQSCLTDFHDTTSLMQIDATFVHLREK